MIDKKNLGQWLKSKRLELDLNIRELAKASELTIAQISRIENGLSGITILTLVKFCRGIGVGGGGFSDEFDLHSVVKLTASQQFNNLDENKKEKFSSKDVIAFVNFLIKETKYANDLLLQWLSESIAEYQYVSIHAAEEEAIGYIENIFNDPQSELAFPYPEHIKTETLDSLLHPQAVMTFQDAGNYIRATRRKFNTSIEVLAQDTGISFSTLSNLERGVMERIKLNDILKLERVLNGKGRIFVIFWLAAEFHSHVWKYEDDYVGRQWRKEEFLLAKILVKIVRWRQAIFPDDQTWLYKFRKDNKAYYELSLDNPLLKYYKKSTPPIQLAEAVFDKLAPYFDEISHEYKFRHFEERKAKLPPNERRIWEIVRERVYMKEDYDIIFHDFLNNPTDVRLQETFKFIVETILTRDDFELVESLLELSELPHSWGQKE